MSSAAEQSNLISSYVEGELRARRMLEHARDQVEQSGVPADLKRVNRELEQALRDEMSEGFDTIRVDLPGLGTRFVKQHQKRTPKRVTPDAIVRAFDAITEQEMMSVAADKPDLGPVEWLLECLLAHLNDDIDNWSISTRIELEERPLKAKRVAEGGSDIRVAVASARVVELATRQFQLREQKKHVNAYMAKQRQTAEALRKRDSETQVRAAVERSRKQGNRMHYHGLAGERTSLSNQPRTVAAKPVTVPMLRKEGMLAEILSGSVDPTVYGATASDVARYLAPDVRNNIVAAFNVRVEEHKGANTSSTPALRVHTLGKRKAR